MRRRQRGVVPAFVDTRPFTSARPVERSADVLIVGGGIIGCALARELARAGARVTVLERYAAGGEASAAAAGMLGPQAECDAAGFDKRVTAEAVGGIVTRALAVAPSLRDARFAASWAGLRPGTPDGRPIIGPDPGVRGLLHATGHYRSEILLAPLTAKVVAELALEGRTSYDVAPFAPARFCDTLSDG